jgi:lipid-A-disaccharide synthase
VRASGDLLGSRVIRALTRLFRVTEAELVEGIGGEAMQAEGLRSLYPMERLAVMGLVEPLRRLPELLRLRRRSCASAGWRRRLFPGYRRTGLQSRPGPAPARGGVPTAQLVSPTVWAWRSGRVHAVARAVDTLLCLFPFEPRYYREGLDVRRAASSATRLCANWPMSAGSRRGPREPWAWMGTRR